MLHLPCYISTASLALVLLLREHQHNRTVKGLIDKILIQHDLEPIPDSHPLAEVLSHVTRKAEEPERKEPPRVRFRIPGMDVMAAMTKGKSKK